MILLAAPTAMFAFIFWVAYIGFAQAEGEAFCVNSDASFLKKVALIISILFVFITLLIIGLTKS